MADSAQANAAASHAQHHGNNYDQGASSQSSLPSGDASPSHYPGYLQSRDLMYQQHNNSMSSSSQEDDSPFFADMTLDLATAHDIAETPEPHKHHVIMPHGNNNPGLRLPKFAAGSSVHPTAGDFYSLGNGPSHLETFDQGESQGQGLDVARAMTSPGTEEKAEEDHVEGQRSAANGVTRVVFADDVKAQAHDSRTLDSAAESTSSLSKDSNRISIQDDHSSPTRHMSSFSSNRLSNRPTSFRSRYPRDVPWAIAFVVFVPLSLLVPALSGVASSTRSKSDLWMARQVAPRLATIHTLLWGYLATVIVARVLYRTTAGGDGDDARHVASQMLLISAPVSASIYFTLTIGIFIFTPGAWYYAVIPIWYLGREIYLVRRWKRMSTTPNGRQAFFQALTSMTLDLISRSLRRLSFYRTVSSLMLVQLGVVYLWRAALLGALRQQRPLLILLALIGGKWATGTVARLLSLIASGGVASWFEQQQIAMNETEMQEQGRSNGLVSNGTDSDDWGEIRTAGTEEIIFSNEPSPKSAASPTNIMEAYRTADASEYKSVLAVEDDMDDDDFENDDDSVVDRSAPTQTLQMNNGNGSTNVRVSNVKSLLFSGLTNSFGSVAQCGLLGGPAQFVWSQVRKVDHATETLRGFRGMNIGEGSSQDTFSAQLWTKVNIWARAFVRCHSDLAMSHVAVYHKTYRRAAQDVATLVDQSGVEPIIDDDISTHISACVGGSISGVIVIITGFILVQHRNHYSPDISDAAVVQDMLLAFVLCYTLIFTVMEPLRAGIKAVYVSFAQHPQSLRQAYPIIFHRLQRMSESNLT